MKHPKLQEGTQTQPLLSNVSCSNRYESTRKSAFMSQVSSRILSGKPEAAPACHENKSVTSVRRVEATHDVHNAPRTIAEDSPHHQATEYDFGEDALHRTTWMQSFLHLLKGYIGPGCLSLPWAVSQLGIASGAMACFDLVKSLLLPRRSSSMARASLSRRPD